MSRCPSLAVQLETPTCRSTAVRRGGSGSSAAASVSVALPEPVSVAWPLESSVEESDREAMVVVLARVAVEAAGVRSSIQAPRGPMASWRLEVGVSGEAGAAVGGVDGGCGAAAGGGGRGAEVVAWTVGWGLL